MLAPRSRKVAVLVHAFGALMICTAAAWASGTAVPDAQQLELGRRLFQEGRNGQGEPVRALMAMSAAPLSGPAVACGNCHGADGRGRPEGSVLPPDITWEELTKPYGHQHGNGRRHDPFDERTFARALLEGLDPSGGRIDSVMPRYSLSTTEVAALIAYVKQLAGVRDPGISDATLRLGTVLPDSGPAADTGAALRAMLRAYIGDLNERGGVNGRRVELLIANTLEQAAHQFKAAPVFALVSPYAVGSEATLFRFAAERRMGIVGPFTMNALPETSLQTFFLFPGEAEMSRVLIEHAGRQANLTTQRWAAFVSDPEGATARIVRQECETRKCGGLEVLPNRSATDPGELKRLMLAGTEAVLFTGSSQDLTRLLSTADQMNWHPSIYTPAAGLAKPMFDAGADFSGKLFAAYPMRADRAPTGANAMAFENLRRSRSLGDQHLAAQTFAFAAMAITEEGLRQAGRDLSRERFARAVEGLHGFDAGPLPPISFGPGRRIGVFGGYVVSIDPQRGVRPASDWIALEGR